MRHYLMFGIVTGVLVFLLFLLYNPQMWLVGLLAGAAFGWMHGLIGMAILGVLYIVFFVLYPFVRLFTNKENAKRVYSDIDGKEAIQCIVWFCVALFPTILMICDSFGRPDPKTAISSIAAFDNDDGEYVYICTGPYSKKYHKTEDCMWLENCSEDVERISIEEAEDMGRTPCKGCY